MASKFINTEHKQTIEYLIEGQKQRLKNPYYLYNDKSATITDFYLVNEKATSLDEGTRDIYAHHGGQSPMKYDLIRDVYLFGVGKIDIDLDYGEWGLEASDIGGDCFVLPNTFVPLQNSYFVINHHDHRLLFKVTSVSPDTLDDGSNIYKMTYSLDRLDERCITNNVIDEYRMVVNNAGTQYKAIIRSEDYNFIQRIEEITTSLKTYYENLFFVDYLQTFIYEYDGYRFYDPFLIEFLIRNNILGGADKYIYVEHQIHLNKTFAIDYDNSFFRSVEIGNAKCINNPVLNGIEIEDINSLMTTRYEKYFKVCRGQIGMCYPIPTTDQDFIEHIQNKKLYHPETEKEFYNCIIAYFNHIPLDEYMIDAINRIEYYPNITLFYTIPIIIYVLENKIKELLK